MGDDIDDSSSARHSPSGLSVTHAPDPFRIAIDDFLENGYPYVERILELFAATDAPDEVKVPILRVFGRYLHTLQEARVEVGLNLEAAHTCALNSVMGDPQVSAMIDKMMNDGMAQIVAKAVE
jgi:hypothetical protein